MKKIAMFTMGTRGDVQPYIYLSKGLMRKGSVAFLREVSRNITSIYCIHWVFVRTITNVILYIKNGTQILPLWQTMLLSLEGNEIYTVKLPYGAMKIIDALDGLVGGIEQKKNALEEGLTDLHNQLENAKAEIGKPFPEEERLKEVRARLAEVNAELELDKSSDDIIDEPDSLDEGEIITEERKRKRSVC